MEEDYEYIKLLQNIFTTLDEDMSNPDDICYIRWFDEYQEYPLLKIDLSFFPICQYMDVDVINIINEYLTKIISLSNTALSEIEIIDLQLNAQFLEVLQKNKKIKCFSYEYKINDYIFTNQFYEFIKQNDTIQYLSLVCSDFDINPLLDSLYENNRIECLNYLSGNSIAQKLFKGEDKRFHIQKIESLSLSHHNYIPGQFYLIEGTRVFKRFYLITKKMI
jgi:hypothetical protein